MFAKWMVVQPISGDQKAIHPHPPMAKTLSTQTPPLFMALLSSSRAANSSCDKGNRLGLKLCTCEFHWHIMRYFWDLSCKKLRSQLNWWISPELGAAARPKLVVWSETFGMSTNMATFFIIQHADWNGSLKTVPAENVYSKAKINYSSIFLGLTLCVYMYIIWCI